MSYALQKKRKHMKICLSEPSIRIYSIRARTPRRIRSHNINISKYNYNIYYHLVNVPLTNASASCCRCDAQAQLDIARVFLCVITCYYYLSSVRAPSEHY